MVSFIISENESGQRLDRFLRKYLSMAPLSFIYRIIRKDVKINGKRAQEGYILSTGDEVKIYAQSEIISKFIRSDNARLKSKTYKRQFSIAYEDKNLLIVNKPRGMLTHGNKSEKKNHLTNQVINYLIESGEYDPKCEKTFVPSPSNRLDRNTSGLVIFAKNYNTLRAINSMIRSGTSIGKYYLAIVGGRLNHRLSLVDTLTKDDVSNRVKIVYIEQGESRFASSKEIRTEVSPVSTIQIKPDKVCTLVEVKLLTGRTHQIRVHMAQAGYPIVGDPKYGNKALNQCARQEFGITFQMLCAFKLTFSNCPDGYEYLNDLKVEINLPKDMKQIIKT